MIDDWKEKSRLSSSQEEEAATQLQGASLVRAQLQGALLDEAQLQGASLVSAQLQDVRGTPNVDLADLRYINATPTKVSEGLNPTFWHVASSSQLQGEEGQRKRVEFLVNLACLKISVPYVARGGDESRYLRAADVEPGEVGRTHPG